MQDNATRQTFTIRIRPDLLDKLQRLADAEHRSRGQMVETLILRAADPRRRRTSTKPQDDQAAR